MADLYCKIKAPHIQTRGIHEHRIIHTHRIDASRTQMKKKKLKFVLWKKITLTYDEN